MGSFSTKSLPAIEGHNYEDVIEAVAVYKNAFQEKYMMSYKWFLMQSIHSEIEGKNTIQKWHLHQREWTSYNRPLKQGYLYILCDEFGKKWKKRYCVLQSDYSFQAFTSKENFDLSGSHVYCKKFSGYQVAPDADAYLRTKFIQLCRDFGYVTNDVAPIIKKIALIGKAGKRPTQHVFCVSQTWRGTVYFAADTAIEKDYWLRVLMDGSRHLEGVQCEDEVAKRAFSYSVEHSIRCTDFPVDQELLCGTPEEILIDMTADFQSVDCKSVVLPKLKGGIIKRIKTWLFIMNGLHGCIKGMVDGHFSAFQKSCHENCKRVDIIMNLPNYTDAYEDASKAITDVLKECFDPIVENDVLPFVPDLVDLMSLASPMQNSRDLFNLLVDGVKEKCESSTLFANNFDQYFVHTLDFAPRDPQFTSTIPKPDNKELLTKLKSMFRDVEFDTLLESIYIHQHQLLDSAVCTFESLCGDTLSSNDGHLTLSNVVKVQSRVLKKLHYDILLSQRRFLHGIILSGTMSITRKSIEDQCKARMLDFEMLIPGDLKEFMPITNVFTDVLTKRFTKLVKPEINICIEKTVARNSLTTKSLSTISSISSSISIVDTDVGFQASSDKPVPIKSMATNSNATDSASIKEDEHIVADTNAMDGETGEMYLSNPPNNVDEDGVVIAEPCQNAEERWGSDSGINEGSDSETNSTSSLARQNCSNAKTGKDRLCNRNTLENCVHNTSDGAIHSNDLPIPGELLAQNCADFKELGMQENGEIPSCVYLPSACSTDNCDVDNETGNLVISS